MKKKVNKLNKRFFHLENNLSIKSILMHLNISEETFYKYNEKNDNILDFKINQFFRNLELDWTLKLSSGKYPTKKANMKSFVFDIF